MQAGGHRFDPGTLHSRRKSVLLRRTLRLSTDCVSKRFAAPSAYCLACSQARSGLTVSVSGIRFELGRRGDEPRPPGRSQRSGSLAAQSSPSPRSHTVFSGPARPATRQRRDKYRQPAWLQTTVLRGNPPQPKCDVQTPEREFRVRACPASASRFRLVWTLCAQTMARQVTFEGFRRGDNGVRIKTTVACLRRLSNSPLLGHGQRRDGMISFVRSGSWVGYVLVGRSTDAPTRRPTRSGSRANVVSVRRRSRGMSAARGG